MPSSRDRQKYQTSAFGTFSSNKYIAQKTKKQQEKMQPQQSSPNRTPYIYLGILTIDIKVQDWHLLKEYEQALTNLSLNECKYQPGYQPQNEPYFCTIQCQESLEYTSRSQYNVVVGFRDGDDNVGMVKSEGEMYGEGGEQQLMRKKKFEENVILRLRIHTYEFFINQLYNLTQLNIIKLSKPFAIDKGQKSGPYYGDCSEVIGVRVFVHEKFLILATDKFNEHQNIIKRCGDDYQRQYDLMQQRCRFLSNNQPEIKAQFRYQENFIRILSHIVTENDVYFGMDQVKKVKEARYGRLLGEARQLFYSELKKRQKKGYTGPRKTSKLQFSEILSLNFLKQPKQSAQMFDIDPNIKLQHLHPSDFEGQLKSYQSRALHWMLLCEGQGKQDIGINRDHEPYWWNVGSALGLRQYLYVNKTQCWISWKQKVLKQTNGGILADEMGMGKTIMIIALILAHRPREDCKTLIISPLSLIKQWKDQLTIFAPFLRVHIANDEDLTDRQINFNDIVIATEGKIRGLKKKSKDYNTLLDYHWFRIILDQAHIFKNHKGKMAENVFMLNSDYRWCLTGTPIQNTIQDLYFMIKFLRFTPWCFDSIWQANFLNKESNQNEIQQYLKIKNILQGVILRRKKQSIDSQGNKLLSLPDVQTNVRFVEMQQQARRFYVMYNYNARKQYQEYNRLGQGQQKKYTKTARNYKHQIIWSLIMKMRMISCHEFLAGYATTYVRRQNFATEYLKFLGKNRIVRPKKPNTLDSYMGSSQAMRRFQEATQRVSRQDAEWNDKIRQICFGAKYQCQICKGDVFQVIAPCLHIFCKLCLEEKVYQKWKNSSSAQQQNERTNNIKQEVQKDKRRSSKVPMKQFDFDCPTCGSIFTLKQIFHMPRINEFNRPLQQFKQNQKILVLLNYIKQMKYKDKALVFTSFVGMLTLIHYTLAKNQIKCVTISGQDSSQLRHQRIKEFNTDPNVIVLISTLKTGSVGLNLQVANKIFFMDPWWNPAIEQQAIGRTHRLGQQREVQAYKLITSQTIQVRVLKRAISKQQISDMVLDIDDIQNDTRYSCNNQNIRYLLEMDDDKYESLEEEKLEKLEEKLEVAQDFGMEELQRIANGRNFFQSLIQIDSDSQQKPVKME